MKKFGLLLLSICNLCFAPSGSGNSNLEVGKAKVEIRNDRKDLVVSSGNNLFAYNTVGQLGEVPQGPGAVNSDHYTLTIGTQNSKDVIQLTFGIYLAGALATRWNNYLGLKIIPVPYYYMINGTGYPGSTLVISSPTKKDVVLWGNSPMGSKAQASDVYPLPNGTKFTVVREVVYESGERKAKIYIQ